jgi:hypothetical protein
MVSIVHHPSQRSSFVGDVFMDDGNWFDADTEQAALDERRQTARKNTLGEDGNPTLVGCIEFCEQRFGPAAKYNPAAVKAMRIELTLQFGQCVRKVSHTVISTNRAA